MPKWITEVNTKDGLTYFGDYIDADTQEHANEIVQSTGRGYMVVTDKMLVEEIEQLNKTI